MKKEVILITFVILFLFCIGTVTGQPPLIQPFDLIEGYEIKIPEQGRIRLNQSYEFHFHIINISNGVQIDNSLTECFFHLYNQTGNHIVQARPTYDTGTNVFNEWEMNINSANFTTPGDYSYIVQCNSTTLGGAVSVGFMVSNTKEDIDTGEALLYILLTIAVSGLFLLSLYAMIMIPYSNKINERGAVIKITKAKYFKLLSIIITYALFVWLLNVLIGVSDNFVGLTMYYGLMEFLFNFMNYIALPFSIFIIVVGLFEIIRDANLQKNLNKLGEVFK